MAQATDVGHGGHGGHGGGGAADAHAHPAHLAHHWDTPHQQFDAGKLGMWLFLVTEVLLFGGLFCAYSIYRGNHPEMFINASQHLNTELGALNTLVLLCSSLTMAWGVRCAQLNQRTGLMVNLALTFLCGGMFMGIKYFEYSAKWEHGKLWGFHYGQTHGHEEEHPPTPGHAEGGAGAAAAIQAWDPEASLVPLKTEDRSGVSWAAQGPPGMRDVHEGARDEALEGPEPPNLHIFFGIYFAMTGLHGLHVLAGMGIMLWLLVRAAKNHFSSAYFTPVELGGLYWHLVDLIWIFLFPLLYLIY